jgi:hypothetical protein
VFIEVISSLVLDCYRLDVFHLHLLDDFQEGVGVCCLSEIDTVERLNDKRTCLDHGSTRTVGRRSMRTIVKKILALGYAVGGEHEETNAHSGLSSRQ